MLPRNGRTGLSKPRAPQIIAAFKPIALHGHTGFVADDTVFDKISTMTYPGGQNGMLPYAVLS